MSFADGPPPGEGSDTEATNAKGDISAPKKPVEIDPDDLLDEEFGPTGTGSKKGKKDKGKKAANDEDEGGDDAEDAGPKLLSKKEKEKLKKEKEKVFHLIAPAFPSVAR